MRIFVSAGSGNRCGVTSSLQSLARREDQRGVRRADPQRVARRPADQEPVVAVVQRQVADLAGEIGQRDFDLRPALRVVGGRQLHQQLGVQRGGRQRSTPS